MVYRFKLKDNENVFTYDDSIEKNNTYSCEASDNRKYFIFGLENNNKMVFYEVGTNLSIYQSLLLDDANNIVSQDSNVIFEETLNYEDETYSLK